jgi:hypothetical protein
LHGHSHAAQINPDILRLNSHGRADACSESRGHEVSGRESFAFALIIARSVCGNFCLGGTVRRVAMQVPGVLN